MSEQPPLLLCTDLDRTLLPNGPQPESPEARQWLRQLVAQGKLVMAYVSGRDRWLVEAAMANYRLPLPAFVISDVGSTIYDYRHGQWCLLQDWHREIAPDWVGFTHADLVKLLQQVEVLRLQEERKQNRYKLSYYLPLDCMGDVQLEQRIADLLEQQGIRATLIWSVDEPEGVGLLDILPQSASKLHAISFLRDWLQLDRQHILFSGDSGNDLPALVSDFPAVLVANAADDVRETALRQANDAGHAALLYTPQEGVAGMNGNYAGGIVAGIDHFYPNIIPSCIKEQNLEEFTHG